MEDITKNPWLGLKSYSEGKRLYGRDLEIDELSQKIIYNTQTVVYGKSGIGKSSLLKAGVFPILRRNGYFPVYIRFVHEDGEDSYTQQIINAVETALKKLKVEDLKAPEGNIQQIVEGYKEEVVSAYQEGHETMWEYFHRHRFYYQLNEHEAPCLISPVLVFDQFEEIFTLQKDERLIKDFFVEFSSLLNNICPDYLLQPTIEINDTIERSIGTSLIKKGVISKTKRKDYIDETNLHVVLSLREDCLFYLERNTENIPSLKHNRYCLLPLNEDQAAEVIMQPIPGLVSKDVTKEIISKVTGKSVDEFEIDDNPELEVNSSILSLFLSELYEKKGDVEVISHKLVDEFGANIIFDFYVRKIEDRTKISDKSVHFLERRLVTADANGTGRRDNIYVDQAYKHGITKQEIKYLCDDCRLLHQYPWRDGMRIELSHDVLCEVVTKRRNQREDEHERIRREETLRQLKKDKQRYIYTLACLLIILCVSIIFVWDGWFRVHTKRYADIVQENTWMKGLRLLSKDEATHLRVHYVFYSTGRYANHADSIEARNGYGKLTSNHGMGTYLVNQFDDSDNKADKQIVDQLKRVVKWVLIPDYSNEFCLQEKAYDEEGSLIYAYNNTVLDDHVIMSTYVNEFGLPIIMRDSCYIFLKTTLDENGHQILQEFYDDKGFPIENMFDSYKLARTYLPNGLQTSEASLFVNGFPMIDRVGNCGWKALDFTQDNCNVTLSAYFDSQGNVCYDNDSIMIKKWQYDNYGRCVKETYWKIEEEYDIEELEIGLSYDLITLHPNCSKEGIHGYIYEYNDYGQTTLMRTIDSLDNKVIPSNQNYAEIHQQYDSYGNCVSEIGVDKDGNHTYEYFANYLDNGDLIYQKSLTIDEYQDTTLLYYLFWDDVNNRLIEKDYYPYFGYYVYRELDLNRERLPLLEARYEIATNQPLEDIDGLHKIIYTYQHDQGKKCLTTTKHYYDISGAFCGYEGIGSYHKEIVVLDSLNYTKSIRQFTTDNILQYGVEFSENTAEKLLEGYEFLYTDNTFEVQVGEASIDENGHRCRTYNNNAYYYQVKYITSILPSHNSFRKGFWVINEFGEQSLARVNGELYSAQLFNTNQYFDEYNQEIKSGEEIDRPMFVAIENGYDIGFCDGDILVQQDDWVLWTNSSFDVSLSGLNLEPQSATEHTFKVLRFDEQNNDYELVEIIIPQNDERICQVKYMKYYVTKKEYRRINRTLRNKLYPHMFEFIPKEDGALWNAGMTSPGLIISINEWEMTNHFKGDKDSLYKLIKEFNGVDKHITVYDEETEKINKYTVSSDTLGVALESYTLRPTYFSEIYNKWVEYTE